MAEYDWMENTTEHFQHIFGGKCKMIGGLWELLECILISQTNFTEMKVAPQEAISGWIYTISQTTPIQRVVLKRKTTNGRLIGFKEILTIKTHPTARTASATENQEFRTRI